MWHIPGAVQIDLMVARSPAGCPYTGTAVNIASTNDGPPGQVGSSLLARPGCCIPVNLAQYNGYRHSAPVNRHDLRRGDVH